jgi:hypothetical protein
VSKNKEKPSVEKVAEEKPKKMQTVYTHGKTFVIPADKDLKEFLKEKYPEEYK